jgi:hypothetical protein
MRRRGIPIKTLPSMVANRDQTFQSLRGRGRSSWQLAGAGAVKISKSIKF